MPVPMAPEGAMPPPPIGPMDAVAFDNLSKVRIRIIDWTPHTTAVVYCVTPDFKIRAVRNAEPALLSEGWWVGDDFEMPLDTPIFYRAVVDDDTMIQSNTVTVHSNGAWWLKHPGRPTSNMKIELVTGSLLKRNRPTAQGIFTPLNRKYPVAVTTVRRAPSSAINVFTENLGELEAIRKITDDGSVLFLQGPAGRPFNNQYIAIGDIDEDSFHLRIPGDVVSMPFQTVQRPGGEAGGGVGSTWNDVAAAYSTWTELATAHADWESLAVWLP